MFGVRVLDLLDHRRAYKRHGKTGVKLLSVDRLIPGFPYRSVVLDNGISFLVQKATLFVVFKPEILLGYVGPLAVIDGSAGVAQSNLFDEVWDFYSS